MTTTLETTSSTGLCPLARGATPVVQPSRTCRTAEYLCYSAAEIGKSVSHGVRGAAAEVTRDTSAAVPQLPKGCFSF